MPTYEKSLIAFGKIEGVVHAPRVVNLFKLDTLSNVLPLLLLLDETGLIHSVLRSHAMLSCGDPLSFKSLLGRSKGLDLINNSWGTMHYKFANMLVELLVNINVTTHMDAAES